MSEMNDRLQRLIDEHDIVEVTTAYCWALDTREFDRLDEVFTSDAVALYIRLECAGLEAIKAKCVSALTPLDASQHYVSNHEVVIDGDRARCRCYLQAQHVKAGTAGGPNFIIGGTYDDELIRTSAGWRIVRRTLRQLWTEGNPVVAGRSPG